MPEKEKPYEPKYKGFDEETTRRAQETAEHAREHPAARGEYVDATYLEEGPEEYRRRMGEEPSSPRRAAARDEQEDAV